jgi:hypothetical protein
MSEASGKYPSDFKKKKGVLETEVENRYLIDMHEQKCQNDVARSSKISNPFTLIYFRSHIIYLIKFLFLYIYIYDHTVQICLI